MLLSMKIWDNKMEVNKVLKVGSILLSEPFMEDENFKRKVILITKYDKKEGVAGLILNQPTELKLRTALPHFPMGYDPFVLLGGPVGTDMIQMLHNLGNVIPDSLPIADGIFWGGNFEQVKKYIRKGEINDNHIRFYIGYTGWDFDQLHTEIKENSWIIGDLFYHDVFAKNYQDHWKNCMIRMGDIYKQMATLPESPNFN